MKYKPGDILEYHYRGHRFTVQVIDWCRGLILESNVSGRIVGNVQFCFFNEKTMSPDVYFIKIQPTPHLRKVADKYLAKLL